MAYDIVSLCTGVGGLDEAVKASFPGSRVVAFSEIDPKLSRWYQTYREPQASSLGDVRDVEWGFWHPAFRSNPLILTAGYPCQPFSQAGKRLGENDPRHLWPEVRRAIRDLRPELVVLENVRNHLRIGFPEVLGDLADLGFDADWSVLRASDVGAPHRRERIFVIAYPHNP